MKNNGKELLASSFRDPAGYVFKKNNEIFRQVNKSYENTFEQLVESGLYDILQKKQLLLEHEKQNNFELDENAYAVIKPQQLQFISYPFEWSFSQLKDAALTTLRIQKIALSKNMSLKDASAYNVQFIGGRAVFIDSLSFEEYRDGQPWVAYQQFCQHFLAPLALMAKTDIQLNRLLQSYIDGLPLPLVSKLLPLSTKFNFSLLVHLHLHAKVQERSSKENISSKKATAQFSKKAFLALIDNLKSCIEKLTWKPEGTEWQDYYASNNNYDNDSLEDKEKIIAQWLQDIRPKLVWDLGANTGKFSRIAAKTAEYVCAWDIDPACVELNYQQAKAGKEDKILPLLLDLTNPSPSIGWANEERDSLSARGPVDMILALGLVHHLAISNNLPLEKIAAFLAGLCQNLIIEFIPKSDSQVKKLLQNREDIFTQYTQESFEEIFSNCFSIIEMAKIPDTQRSIYLMKVKQ